MTNNIPATVGMPVEDIDTPCLLVELDAFERNVAKLAKFIKDNGLRHRAHAKTHKSSDIAIYQIEKGGACGVCCQKVSEAEALVSAGIRDVLVSNEVGSPKKIERLAALATRARVIVCVDDLDNVDDLSAGAQKYGATIECLVEIDVGAGRCGVTPGEPAVKIAKKIHAAPGLRFSGLQAYQGKAQHAYDYAERKALIKAAIEETANTIQLLKAEGVGLRHCRGSWYWYLRDGRHKWRLQRIAVRIVYLHGRGLSACKGRERQIHLGVRKQPLHLYVGHEQDQGGQGHLRRRSEGPHRRQWHARHLWADRCRVHQVFRRTWRHPRPSSCA